MKRDKNSLIVAVFKRKSGTIACKLRSIDSDTFELAELILKNRVKIAGFTPHKSSISVSNRMKSITFTAKDWQTVIKVKPLYKRVVNQLEAKGLNFKDSGKTMNLF